MDTQITPKAAVNRRGLLTITFSGTYSTSGNSVDCDLTGNASWSSGIFDGVNSPAVGSDFIGMAWSGGFEGLNPSASATFQNGNSQNVYRADASANAGRVWSFDEYWNVAGKYTLYVNNVDVSTTLHKNHMNGGENKAEAILKYIHTYQAATGGVSITASSSGIGSGFTLNGTSKQWDLSCIVTGIPY